jgi:DNA repair exonuclease SbcCD ATPase subunit
VAARLLVVQTRGDSGGGTVEIVHESLIERWPTLRRWLDEDQEDAAFLQDLTSAAKQWDAKGRPTGMLWTGDAMLEARRWYTARPRSLPPREQAFIDAVLALARRTTRTRRILLGTAFAILGAFAVVASIGYMRVKAAQEDARTALVVARENEKRATDALDAKRAEETARKQAEGKALTAEEQRAAEEKARLEAEASKVATEKMSREQLEAKNAELEASLRDSKSARDRAEAASKKAEAAAAEAKRLQAELAEKLKAEQERVKQLQAEMKKISTQLKE